MPGPVVTAMQWARLAICYIPAGKTFRWVYRLARREACRELFRQTLAPGLAHAVRVTVQAGTPLCNDRFREQVEIHAAAVLASHVVADQ